MDTHQKVKLAQKQNYFFWPNMFIHPHDGFADEIPFLNKYEVTMGPWF